MIPPKYHRPFSPMIMESTVPDKFVNIVNDTADKVLNSETASMEWDWSHKLVGKVSKEVQIPVRDKTNRELLFSTMKGACVDYLKECIKSNTAYGWKKIAGDAVPTMDNIHMAHSWVVSQYAGEYNPWHHHSGDFSAVIYLKLPPKMNEQIEEEWKDHYRASENIDDADTQTYGEPRVVVRSPDGRKLGILLESIELAEIIQSKKFPLK